MRGKRRFETPEILLYPSGEKRQDNTFLRIQHDRRQRESPVSGLEVSSSGLVFITRNILFFYNDFTRAKK
jgi:hypothetical protein